MWDKQSIRVYPCFLLTFTPLVPDTQGFDVTGVVTEVDLTFPQVQSACDCIQECLNRPTTCAAYVYKFSTPASLQSGHRTCTLYSQFNLPSAVAIDINLNSTLNNNINAAEITMMNNNPQNGAPVPQAFKDANLNTTPDDDAVSGYVHHGVGYQSVLKLILRPFYRPVWQLMNGQAQC
jgi:hypothetical protein